jgi:putative endonuclease
MWAWLGRLVGADGPRDERGLGRAGERYAAKLLKRAGYRVLGRNVVVRDGEADLVCVAPDGVTIVIVEVKTRRPGIAESAQGANVAPEASIHAGKRKKLLDVSRTLAKANGWRGRPVRIDVVAVEWREGHRPPLVRHYPDVVVAETAGGRGR